MYSVQPEIFAAGNRQLECFILDSIQIEMMQFV